MSAALSLSATPGRPLTADLCARAIVAAAAVYGDNAVRVLTAKRGFPRRSLHPAIYGIAAATGVTCKRLREIFRAGNNAAAVKATDERYHAAVQAAFRAADFAGWRPEARETMVGGAGHDLVAAPAAEDTLPPIEELLAVAVEAQPALTHPEMARPVHRPAGGMISSTIRPSLPPAARVTTTSALRDRILDVLKDGSATAKGLASILGDKELSVIQTLRCLQYEGLIDAERPSPDATRDQMRWALVPA